MRMCRVSVVSCGCRPAAAIGNGATNHVFAVLNICVWVCPVGSVLVNMFVNHFVNPFAMPFVLLFAFLLLWRGAMPRLRDQAVASATSAVSRPVSGSWDDNFGSRDVVRMAP